MTKLCQLIRYSFAYRDKISQRNIVEYTMNVFTNETQYLSITSNFHVLNLMMIDSPYHFK